MSTNDADDGKSIDHTDAETLRRLYWDEELSAKDIADRSDVSRRTICRWMDKNGIERRDRKEAARMANGNLHPSFRTLVKGYETAYSTHNSKHNSVYIHRLIAVAEYGVESVNDNDVHHENGIKWDNRPENIELKDPSKHVQDHKRAGGGHRTLTEEQAREIQKRLDKGDTVREIAPDYPVTVRTIKDIKWGETWDHLR